MTKRFTDNQLAQLYLNMAKDYHDCSDRGYALADIHQHIYSKLYYSLSDPTSSLYELDPQEKQRVWAVYYAFFNSTPAYRHQCRSFEQQNQFWGGFRPNTVPLVVIEPRHRYCAHDTLLDWLLLSSVMNSINRNQSGYYNRHHHGHENKNGNVLLLLLLLVLTTFAVAASAIALYYILNSFLNSTERLIHNEGQLRAAVTIASILGGAAGGALFGTFIASMPIIMFGIAAGLSNPVGLAITAAVCLTILGAAAACGLTQFIQNKIIQHQNKDALDPRDPVRYSLSPSEEENLIEKGYDIYTVKLALVALREKIGKETPSFLNRMFTEKGKTKQQYLELIRQIKKGSIEASYVDVDDMHFDFARANPYAVNSDSRQRRFTDYPYPTTQTKNALFTPPAAYIPGYQQENYNTVPSAPPLDYEHGGPLYPSLG